MLLNEMTPYVRFADILTFREKRGLSATYDSRLFYVLRGEAKMELAGRKIPFRRGNLITFPPQTPYYFVPEPEVTLIVFDFDPTLAWARHSDVLPPCPVDRFDGALVHRWSGFSDAPFFSDPVCLEHAAFLETKMQEIVLEFRQKRLFFREKSGAIFKELFIDLARSVSAGTEEKDVINRILEYVDEHLHEPVTNAEIGEALFYNPNYLNRIMLRQTGMSLHHYVLQRRLAIATRMLLTTSASVGEIAAELGFYSTSHFSNFFKKATGVTPARCRKNGAI